MRLAERINNETIVGEKIINISGLENSQLIIMERGDKLKKDIKKAATCFGDKNLHSVKSIKEALKMDITKKVDTGDGTWCCVCVENWTYNSDGICNECHII